MQCPGCKGSRLKVVRSVPVDGGESYVIRKRKCASCEAMVTTEERVVGVKGGKK